MLARIWAAMSRAVELGALRSRAWRSLVGDEAESGLGPLQRRHECHGSRDSGSTTLAAR